MWAPSLRAFFYCRPLVPHPVRDGLFVALDRAAFGHLATPPARPKDAPKVAWVVADAELPADQRGNTLQRPQLVGKPAGHRPGEQPLLKLGALRGGHFPWPAWSRLRRQRCIAMLLPVLNPTMYGSGRGPNPTGDLSNPLPALGQCHGTTTAFLQACCGSDGSHAL